MFDYKGYMKKYNHKHPEKRLSIRERFRIRHPNYNKIQREKNREKISAGIVRWKKENKEKVHAENLVQRKPFAEKCEICDNTQNLVRHHPDYSEPAIYVTLCASCHRYVHEEIAKPT